MPEFPVGQTAAQAEAFKLFSIDDSLSELNKIKKYATSALPLQRLVFVQQIAYIGSVSGVSITISQLVPLLARLITDPEAPIRVAVANQISQLSEYLSDPFNVYGPLPPLPRSISTPAPMTTPTNFTHDETDIHLVQSVGSKVCVPPNPAFFLFLPHFKHLNNNRHNDNNNSNNNNNNINNSSELNDTWSDETMSSIVSYVQGFGEAAANQNKETPTPSSSNHSQEANKAQNDLNEKNNPTNNSNDNNNININNQQNSDNSNNTNDIEISKEVKNEIDSKVPSPVPVCDPFPFSPSPTAIPADPYERQLISPLSTLTSDQLNLMNEGYECIKNVLIPQLSTLLTDVSPEVRQAASDSLVSVAEHLKGEDVGKSVLTLVLNLAHDDRDEHRTTAVYLLNAISPRLGSDLCRNFVALEMIAFSDDTTLRVRKAAAQSFGNVCTIVGPTFTVNKLLPAYLRLSKDLIWGVRKGCVDSLVAIANVVPLETRKEILIPLFNKFITDSSRWVRNGAYECAGPFIHTLGPSLASIEVSNVFSSIPSLSSAVVDPEVNLYAAFNFPAVVLTLGPDRFEELLPCFQTLCVDPKFPVRRTLACAAHEIAHIIGPNLTQKFILPQVDAFLKDIVEVRHGIIKHLGPLLLCMPPSCRVNYIPLIESVSRQQDLWRWRFLIALQAIDLILLFDAHTTATSIKKVILNLLNDPISQVRFTAARSIGPLLRRFTLEHKQSTKLKNEKSSNQVTDISSDDEEEEEDDDEDDEEGEESNDPSLTNGEVIESKPRTKKHKICYADVFSSLVSEIIQLSSSKNYQNRQLYITIVYYCIDIHLDSETLYDRFLPPFALLANDPINNVRVKLATTLINLKQNKSFIQLALIQTAIQTLKNDKHSDIVKRMESFDLSEKEKLLDDSKPQNNLDPSTSTNHSGSGSGSGSGSVKDSSSPNLDLEDLLGRAPSENEMNPTVTRNNNLLDNKVISNESKVAEETSENNAPNQDRIENDLDIQPESTSPTFSNSMDVEIVN